MVERGVWGVWEVWEVWGGSSKIKGNKKQLTSQLGFIFIYAHLLTNSSFSQVMPYLLPKNTAIFSAATSNISGSCTRAKRT